MNTVFNMATADKHQLKKYAQDTLGLSLPLTMGEPKMRERIVAFCKENDMEAPKAEVATKGKKKAKLITINIAKQTGKGGAENAFVGVQGVGYSIPRGIDVGVPPSVVEVLKNARQDIVTQDPETGELLSESVLTHPYQIVANG